MDLATLSKDPVWKQIKPEERLAVAKELYADTVLKDPVYAKLTPEEKKSVAHEFNNDYYMALQESNTLPKGMVLTEEQHPDGYNVIKPMYVPEEKKQTILERLTQSALDKVKAIPQGAYTMSAQVMNAYALGERVKSKVLSNPFSENDPITNGMLYNIWNDLITPTQENAKQQQEWASKFASQIEETAKKYESKVQPKGALNTIDWVVNQAIANAPQMALVYMTGLVTPTVAGSKALEQMSQTALKTTMGLYGANVTEQALQEGMPLPIATAKGLMYAVSGYGTEQYGIMLNMKQWRNLATKTFKAGGRTALKEFVSSSAKKELPKETLQQIGGGMAEQFISEWHDQMNNYITDYIIDKDLGKDVKFNLPDALVQANLAGLIGITSSAIPSTLGAYQVFKNEADSKNFIKKLKQYNKNTEPQAIQTAIESPEVKTNDLVTKHTELEPAMAEIVEKVVNDSKVKEEVSASIPNPTEEPTPTTEQTVTEEVQPTEAIPQTQQEVVNAEVQTPTKAKGKQEKVKTTKPQEQTRAEPVKEKSIGFTLKDDWVQKEVNKSVKEAKDNKGKIEKDNATGKTYTVEEYTQDEIDNLKDNLQVSYERELYHHVLNGGTTSAEVYFANQKLIDEASLNRLKYKQNDIGTEMTSLRTKYRKKPSQSIINKMNELQKEYDSLDEQIKAGEATNAQENAVRSNEAVSEKGVQQEESGVDSVRNRKQGRVAGEQKPQGTKKEEVKPVIKESLTTEKPTAQTAIENVQAKHPELFKDGKVIKGKEKLYQQHMQDEIEALGKKTRHSELTDKEIAQAEYDAVVKQYKGTDKWLKAPNGKPTNLNERQWVQVRTPSFKKWFGDWENDPKNASKVVDENGEPLVVYHGGTFNANEDGIFIADNGVHFGTKQAAEARMGTQPIDSFISDATIEYDEELGAWFWSSQGYDSYDVVSEEGFPSKEYAKKDVEEYASTMVTDDFEFELTATFLNIRKPYTTSDKQAEWSETIDIAKAENYDGVRYINQFEHKGSVSFIAFNSTQIKSATDNIGTFDANNPDIRYQQALQKAGKKSTIHDIVKPFKRLLGKYVSSVKIDGNEATFTMTNGKQFTVNAVTGVIYSMQNGKMLKASGKITLTGETNLLAIAEISKDFNEGNKTAYHEAFHFVYNIMLSDSERATLIRKFKRDGDTEIQTEERITDAFVNHQIKQDAKGTIAVIFDRITSRIKALIRDIFGKDAVRSYQQIFDDISNARYTTETPMQRQVTMEVAKAMLYNINNLIQSEYDAVIKKYKGTDQWMKAPKGNPTNLNERQWVQVMTPSFKKWFKRSKAVDKNGSPKKLYHVSEHNITEYDIAKDRGMNQFGKAIYFTDSLDGTPSGFGSKWNEVYISLQNPLNLNEEISFKKAQEFVDKFSKKYDIKINPIDFEPYDKTIQYGQLLEEMQSNTDTLAELKHVYDNIHHYLTSLGYDGFYHFANSNTDFITEPPSGKYDKQYMNYGVFKSTQVKSATDNVGTFDANNPDIRYSELPTDTEEVKVADETAKKNKDSKKDENLQTAFHYWKEAKNIRQRLLDAKLQEKAKQDVDIKAIREEIKKFFSTGLKNSVNIPEHLKSMYEKILGLADFTVENMDKAMRQARKMEKKRVEMLDKTKTSEFTQTDIDAIIKMFDKIDTLKGLNTAFRIMNEIYDKAVGKKISNMFWTMLKPNVKKVTKSLPKTKQTLPVEIQDEINIISDYTKLTSEQKAEVSNRINDIKTDGLTSEQIDNEVAIRDRLNYLLETFADFNHMTLDKKLEAYAYLSMLINSGKSLYKAIEENKRELYRREQKKANIALNLYNEHIQPHHKSDIEKEYGKEFGGKVSKGLNWAKFLNTMARDFDRALKMNKAIIQKLVNNLEEQLPKLEEYSDEWNDKNETLEVAKEMLAWADKTTETEGYFQNTFFEKIRSARNEKLTSQFFYEDMIKRVFNKIFDKKINSNAQFTLALASMTRKGIPIRVSGLNGGLKVYKGYNADHLAHIYALSRSADENIQKRLINSGITSETLEDIAEWMKNDELGKKVKRWVDWVQDEFYPAYYHTVNAIHRKRYGVNLNMVDVYTQIYSTHEENNLAKNTKGNDFSGELKNMFISSNIARTNSTAPLRLEDMSFTKGLLEYIGKEEHFKAMALPMDELRHTLYNSKVLQGIENMFGRSFRDVLVGFYNDTATNRYARQTHTPILDWFYVGRAIAKIAGKIKLAPKQISSTLLFMSEDKNPANFALNWIESFMPDNKDLMNRMMKNVMLKDRYSKGVTFEQRLAMESMLNLNAKESSIDFINNISANVLNMVNIYTDIALNRFNPSQWGDMASVIAFGGRAYLLSRYKEHLKTNSKEQAITLAMRDFEKAVESTQQSSNPLYVPDINRAGLGRFITQFGTQLFSFTNLNYNILQDSRAGVISRTRAGYKLAVVNILTPFMFLFMGAIPYGIGKDIWKVLQKIFEQDIDSIPIIGNFLSSIEEVLTGRSSFTNANVPVISTSNEIIRGVKSIKKDFNEQDYWKVIKDVLISGEDIWHFPFKTMFDYATGFRDFWSGQDPNVLRMFGFTEDQITRLKTNSQ